MRRFLMLQHWHIAWLFAGLSVSAVLFAWTTVNLYQMASSNFRLITDYGFMGLVDGGLLQFLEICWHALVSLLMFLLFKGCETEIVHRWRKWGGGGQADA